MTNEHYLKYENMINSACHKLTSIFSMYFDDLKCEGNLIYVKACGSYNDSLATFSTYLYKKLYSDLYKYCKKEQEARNMCYEDIQLIVDKQIINYQEYVEDLTEMQLKIVKLRAQGFNIGETNKMLGISLHMYHSNMNGVEESWLKHQI